MYVTDNKHCGKHDKIYTDEKPCPGCVTELEKEDKGIVELAEAEEDKSKK